MSEKKKDEFKRLVTNRKALHNYFILERLEAGMELIGCEVKSLRAGQANMQDSYAQIRNGEINLLNFHISPYPQGNRQNLEPTRSRKLLLHKREARRLEGKLSQKGLTLVPLSIYLKGRWVKVELGLAKGKHTYDKKETLKQKDIKRETDRQMRQRY